MRRVIVQRKQGSQSQHSKAEPSREGRVPVASVAGTNFLYTGRRGRPAGSPRRGDNTIDHGGSYELAIYDGRNGRIEVDLMTVNGRGVTNVYFRGVSDLAAASPARDAGG